MGRLYKTNALYNVLQCIKLMNGDRIGVINYLTVVRIKFILQVLYRTGMLFEYHNLYCSMKNGL